MTMEVSIDRLNFLMDEVRKIHESHENQVKAKFWQVINHDEWQPAFIRTLPNREIGNKIPFVVELGLGLWSKILDFDLSHYYHDPLTYAIAHLEMKIFHAKHFFDDTYIEKNFRLLIATTLEGSILGVPFGYTQEGHPWLDYQHPPIQEISDLDKISLPDFYKSGEMPQLLKFYETITNWLDDDFMIKFPDWIMGPFGVAAELRGFDKLLMDMILEPRFVDDLFAFIVGARKSWQNQLDDYLGIKRTRGLLGNDDVNCPTLSPELYEKQLLPVEIGLCRHYGAIYYWHSCGLTTPLLPYIQKIPQIDLFHCGPWTSVQKACHTFAGRGNALEIMIETIDKVQLSSADMMRKYITETAQQIPAETNCFIKVDSFECMRDVKKEIDVIKTWIQEAREVLG